MATTAQGAIALSDDIRATRAQLKELSDLARQGVALADAVLGPENLGFRVSKGEAPKAEEIPVLHAQFTALKAAIDAKHSAVTVRTVEEYQALAETA